MGLLGEFCALGESLNFISESFGNQKAGVLSKAVDKATQRLLENDKSPARRVGQIDTRDSHFYFALYFADAMAKQTEERELADHFTKLAAALGENERKIVKELASTQGKPCDLGGYYHADANKLENVATLQRNTEQHHRLIFANKRLVFSRIALKKV